MAINMNYSLLSSKNTNNYKIPEYNPGYISDTFSESQIFQLISDFNQELREATYSLNLINYDTEYLNEANVLVTIRDTIKDIIDRIIKAIKSLVDRILEALGHVYEVLTKKQKEIVYVDRIVEKYRVHDRMSLLANALKAVPVQELEISSIVPTAELISKTFPNTNAIGKDLVDMVSSSVKGYISNYKAKNGTPEFDIEAEASEGLASYVNGEKRKILDAIFGKYSYDPTNVMQSAKDAAIKAFGNTEPYKQTLTIALYSQACDNIENGNKDAIESIKNDLKAVETNYNKTMKSLEQLKVDFIKSTSNYTVNNYGDPVKTHNDIRTGFANATDTVVRNLNTIINAINQAVNANITIIAHKIKRIDQVYSVTGDANKVRRLAHRLINDSLGTSDQGMDEAYSVDPETDDAFLREQDIFDTNLVMLEECWLEHEFNAYIEQVILEAEGDDAGGAGTQATTNTTANTSTQSTTNNTTSQQQQNTNTNQNNITNNSKPNDNNSVMRLINKIIDNMVDMYNKFKNRIDSLVIKTDAPFWNTNREKIRGLDFSKVTVNDWYSYDFNALKKSVILNNGNFDINSPDLASDDSFQSALLNNISANKPATEKDNDSFTTKLANRYYTNYITKDANEVELGSLGSKGYNHQQSFAFVDSIVRNGFRDENLASIDKDTETLKKLQKTIKSNKPTLTDNLQDSKADNTPAEPQNAAAIVSGKFNLAEMFALPQKRYSGELPFIGLNEAIGTVPEELQQSAGAVKDAKGERSAATNETDTRINRYFRYTSMAITYRMTVTIKAYKQYMELYKAVYSPKKKSAPNNNNNSNNQQQQNNNQNQQQQNSDNGNQNNK